MTNIKATKRALGSSVLALFLCFAMLLGTTFAWFTDSVTSANNVITAGNLDVNLHYWDNSMANGTSVAIEDEPDLKLLKNVDGEEILWEPGASGFGTFKVANEGTLALKYRLVLAFYNATATEEGKTLADVLSVYALVRDAEKGDDGKMEDANLNKLVTENMDSYVPGYEAQALKDFVLEGYLLPGESFTYELGVFWEPSDVDNDYNVEGGLTIDFGVTLLATQATYEKDSYVSDYDAEADMIDVILAEGGEIIMSGDYKEEMVVSKGADVKINLVGNTLANTLVNKGNVTVTGGDISNNDRIILNDGGSLTIENVTLTQIGGTDYVARSEMKDGENGEIIFNNVNVTSMGGGVSVFGGYAIFNSGSITTNSNSTSARHVFYVDGASLTINDGDFKFSPDNRTRKGFYVCATNGAEVEILGGTFAAPSTRTDNKASANYVTGFYKDANSSIVIKGGTFGFDPSAWLAEGYEANKVGDTWVVEPAVASNEEFSAAIEAGKTTIVLDEGMYTIPANVAGKEITIQGIGDNTVIDFTKASKVSDASITFKNLKIQGKNANVMSGFGIQHTTGDIVYENCTFDGAVTNEYAGTVTYKNCTFTGTGYITTYSVKSATFENCTFDKADSRAVLVYSHGNNPCKVTLTDCTFAADAKGYTGAGDWTAAVEIDTTNISSTGTSVEITNCTFDSNYSNIVRDKSVAGKANAVITVDGNTWVFQNTQLASALTSNKENISVVLGNNMDCPISSLGTITGGSGEYKLGGENTKTITIDLNGKKLNITTTYWSNLGAKNDNAIFTIKNGSMTSSQATGTWNSYDLTFSNCDYVIENVVFDKAVAFDNAGKNVTLKGVTINETHDYYALWITAAGQNVTIDGLTINSAGRGIKIDEQYVGTPAKVTLKVSNAKFTTASKAAIMVKSAAGADITVDNVDISNVAKDTTNVVWVDEDAATSAGLVNVTGGTKIVEA